MIFRYGCSKLTLEMKTSSFPSVKYIMEKLRNVVREKYKIESTDALTPEQMNELRKIKRRSNVEVEWIPDT